jgi:hypothetical protein
MIFSTYNHPENGYGLSEDRELADICVNFSSLSHLALFSRDKGDSSMLLARDHHSPYFVVFRYRLREPLPYAIGV